MAFQAAGSLALREAVAACAVTMLEPLDAVASSSSTSTSGGVLATSPDAGPGCSAPTSRGRHRTVVRAEVPRTELVGYAIDLRSATHGAGMFTRSFAHYEPMPEDVSRERSLPATADRPANRG